MIEGISAPQTGYCHNLIRRTIDAGEKTPETKKLEETRISDEIKKVQPCSDVYNARGKIIEYYDAGRHLDIEAY